MKKSRVIRCGILIVIGLMVVGTFSIDSNKMSDKEVENKVKEKMKNVSEECYSMPLVFDMVNSMVYLRYNIENPDLSWRLDL